jgi:tetratricopeptide (TPR) repeat protein
MLLWAYDVERAGARIDEGMRWPDPRHADSLPQAHDRQALEQALPYLAAAIRQRPADAHAYRLSGQVYAALGDWDHAAVAYEQAIALAPANRLLRWEASLIYRQMHQLAKRSPHTPLTDAFAAATLLAPGELVKSLFCNAGGAETCYFGRAVYRQPYAAYPDQAERTLSVLFLHPPASLVQRITIPPDQAGLHFLVGLDPVARGWATDGAVFRVWVELANDQRQLAAELPLDRATALRGWVPGWADLTPWAGQTITLMLESDAGPRGDRTDDWYGWGDLSLMPANAARYAALLPQLRAAELEREVP